MKRWACAILLLVTAGSNLAAADADEPLADAKRELKQLKADSAAQKSGVADPGLSNALPSATLQPQTTLPISPTAPAKRQSEKDLKKQQDAEKNWLIREYEKLEAKPDSSRSNSEKLPVTLDEVKSDEAQLQDRLSANDPKSREGKDDDARHHRHDAPRAPDPLAPFMKDWLANSPSSGPVFDALTKASGVTASPDAALLPGVGVQPTDLPGNASRDLLARSSPDMRHDRAIATAPIANPYLPALDLSGSVENGPAALRPGPVADLLAPSAIPPAKAPLTLQNDFPEPSRRNTAAPPASKLVEDKKYFPQQKRF